ncbi:hypothetical protein Dester_0849 [Desulfurobacterium thermolithotrophum DSM 11699]|uniref:Prepilin-type N-terminal cleavage/methylation domain-containing protein n=1 Tax=Desulfurobacterium thermolithotrophum (strain DSM 11699 / BSA) TaxID=868864 RepID=F0S3R7_DESTD|nr:type II secretion system protein [Desulfurobacterium thermolithotrophum]ADY73489.1 hypothetical protein Dester_0849 [Desulfurobacterium thermolithotrophum DSM 11699]
MKIKNEGFTLIELLIVITVISILFSISIVSYRLFRINAYDNNALYDLKNLINDELSYYSINQNFIAFSTFNITSENVVKVGEFEHRYLSKNIKAVAKVYRDYANFCTKHKMGDKIYAYQSETDTIYYKKSFQGYELQDLDCPNATPNNDFPSPVWIILAQSR